MSKYLKIEEFSRIATEHAFDPFAIRSYMEANSLGTPTLDQIRKRISTLQRKGLIPLDSGNFVSSAEVLRGTSTLYGPSGEIKAQWVKSDVPKEQQLEAFETAIDSITSRIEPVAPAQSPEITEQDLLVFYPLPDLHFGMLVHGDETNHGFNYDTSIATSWVTGAMEHLVDMSPSTRECVITDLGDFLHSSDNGNRTVSGHILDVDGRHAKIIEAAFNCMVALIDKALTKHEVVHLYSVKGNHSELSSIYLKSFLKAWYRDEPRVQVYLPDKSQQYFRFGKNILGFSHGHELRPANAESVMVFDNADYFSQSEYRYFHFGHFHSNKSFEGPICNIEVHKNIIARDMWAEGMGFRGNIGQAKSIVYHREYGEISRSTFNIQMRPDLVSAAQ